jgi:hypothetical protein
MDHSERLAACIETCRQCHQTCLETVSHCLSLGGRHADPAHIRLLMDCAEICQTSASFMIRDSEWLDLTCAACSEVCARCSEDCESMAEGDGQMIACAAVCRRCAESCHEMAHVED